MTTIHAKSFEETSATLPDTKMDNNLAEHKSEQGLLNRALYASASIHQPHGVKAFLAAQNLADLFQAPSALSQRTNFAIEQKMREKRLKQEPIENPSIWQQISDLIAESEIQVKGQFASLVSAPEFSEFRILKYWI